MKHASLTALFLLLLSACGGNRAADELYLDCDQPDDCDVPDDVEAECLDKSGEGFCTWECTSDPECDEADDEDFDFVCASFENNALQYCFPACNEDAEEAEDECPPSMTCRSTGGGYNNRKVCFPEA